MGNINILLASHCLGFNLGFSTVIANESDMRIVAVTQSGNQAPKLAKEMQPDVALVDVLLPKMNGFDVSREIRENCPYTGVIMTSCNYYGSYLLSAIRSGAMGYLLKDRPLDEMLRAIRVVHSGQTVYELGRARHMMTTICSKDGEPHFSSELLHSRELKILKLVGKGMSSKGIAEELFLSPHTVETHIVNIMKKLQVNSRIQAVLFAINENWFSVGDLLADQKPIEEQRPIGKYQTRLVKQRPPLSKATEPIESCFSEYPDMRERLEAEMEEEEATTTVIEGNL